MVSHISINYYSKDRDITHCGYKPKTVFEVQDSNNGLVTCKKCEDLYFQTYPNAQPYYNPYFDAHDPTGNDKLKAIQLNKGKIK